MPCSTNWPLKASEKCETGGAPTPGRFLNQKHEVVRHDQDAHSDSTRWQPDLGHCTARKHTQATLSRRASFVAVYRCPAAPQDLLPSRFGPSNGIGQPSRRAFHLSSVASRLAHGMRLVAGPLRWIGGNIVGRRTENGFDQRISSAYPVAVLRCLLKRVFKEIVNIAFLTSVRLRTRQLQNITARGLTSRPKGQSHDESASKIAPTPCR